MLITDYLAARLETAEALDAAGCCEAACAEDRNSDAEVKAVAGGVLTFCGPTSPLTHALGIGMHGPVAEADLQEIEEFFHSREAAVVIDLCPHADGSLRELLVARGYRLSEMNNVLVRALGREESPTAAPAIDVQSATDADLFARTVMGGFLGREQLTADELQVGTTLFHMPCATPLLAFLDGSPAGACGVSVRNGVASLYGDGVLPQFRGRGVHSALIAARLRIAADAGCDIATAGTVPRSASQRNYNRHGFAVAYTKLTMVLA